MSGENFPGPGGRRPARTLAVWLGVAVLAWVGLVHGLAPWLIRVAWEGRGPSLLGRVISGRDVHPVEHYLSVWNALLWKLHILAGVGLVLFLLWRPILGKATRVLRAPPAAGARDLLANGLFWGLAAGCLQSLHILVRKSVTPLHAATFTQSIDGVWMAPLAETLVLLAAALILVPLTRAWSRPVSLKLITVLFAFAATYGLLRAGRLGLDVWAIRLLSLGIAVQTGLWVGARAEAWKRRLPALIAGCMAWAVLAGGTLHGSRAFREWRVLRALPAAAGDSPNVVLLILDTVRAASLSLYGHDRPTTPRLEAMAREAAVFDGAVSVASWTLPAHASMLTGRLPWELSVGWRTPLDEAAPTLAEALAGRGYATGGFVGNRIYAGRESGIARGFGHYEDAPISLGMFNDNAWHTRNVIGYIRRYTGWGPGSKKDAVSVSDDFLRWSAKQSGRPFFAMLNYIDAHIPYEAPDSIVAKFSDRPLRREPVNGVVYMASSLEEMRTAYDAAIAFIDQEIGRIVDSLRARGQLDRTVLIVTSDHGEHIGEHSPEMHGHGNSLYASTIRVPLLIRYPPAVPAGVRIENTVSISRIARTVLDLVASDPTLPGPSLAMEFEASDSSNAGTPALSLVLPGFATIPTDPVHSGPMASVVLGDWHYIRNGDGTEEFYDSKADPWELENRVGEAALTALVDRLRPAAAFLDSVRPEAGRRPSIASVTRQGPDGRAGAASRRATAARRAGSE